MGDAGFDVKNPDNVRRDLGGMEQFQDFVKTAKAKGLKIKADLVYNQNITSWKRVRIIKKSMKTI